MEWRITVGNISTEICGPPPEVIPNIPARGFRSEETETNLSIWIQTEISGIFGIMESTPGCLLSTMKEKRGNVWVLYLLYSL